MDDPLAGLAGTLRGADTFAEVAAALIEVLGRRPGVTAVAVEAHDPAGPCAWFATPGFMPPAGHLDGHPAPRPPAPRLEAVVDDTGAGWRCPLIGVGELAGLVRVRAAPATPLGPLLVQACAQASVRIAQVGGGCDDPIGAAALTARQYEVSVLVASGATNAEIARLLSISPDAVKKHVSRALNVLDVSNRAELAAIAARWRCAAPAVPLPSVYTELRAGRSHLPAVHLRETMAMERRG